MYENLPNPSPGNIVTAPPYDSNAEALLYEILMELGGPGQGGQLPFMPENLLKPPPYRSNAESLLYEILGALRSGAGGGGGAAAITIRFGWIKAGNTVDVNALLQQRIVPNAQQYYVIPPVASNLAGQEAESVELVIAEPESQPVKTSSLIIRNGGTVFIRTAINSGGVVTQENAGGYNIYRFSGIQSLFADGQLIGPVFLASQHAQAIGWADSGQLPQAYAYEVRISETAPCSVQPVIVWSAGSVFGTGVQLWLNRALTIPAGSGLVGCFGAVNGGDPGSLGEIFNIANGLVGASTNTTC